MMETVVHLDQSIHNPFDVVSQPKKGEVTLNTGATVGMAPSVPIIGLLVYHLWYVPFCSVFHVSGPPCSLLSNYIVPSSLPPVLYHLLDYTSFISS
jgi:hypothetical protein